jgi:hypothetical protein
MDYQIEAPRSKLTGNRVYELGEANALTGLKQVLDFFCLYVQEKIYLRVS